MKEKTLYYRVLDNKELKDLTVGKIVKVKRKVLTEEDNIKVYSLNGMEVTKARLKQLVKTKQLERTSKRKLVKEFLETL